MLRMSCTLKRPERLITGVLCKPKVFLYQIFEGICFASVCALNIVVCLQILAFRGCKQLSILVKSCMPLVMVATFLGLRNFVCSLS